MTDLFNTAPDLLEDFKQFLPESAAQAKAQAAAARAAADDAMTVSNVRGDSAYAGSQVAQAQTPRPAAKMPPMGQFDPPSTSKENKKRRGGPGQQSSVQTGAPSTSLDAMSGGQGSRIGAVQVGNANKVSHPPLALQVPFADCEKLCSELNSITLDLLSQKRPSSLQVLFLNYQSRFLLCRLCRQRKKSLAFSIAPRNTSATKPRTLNSLN